MKIFKHLLGIALCALTTLPLSAEGKQVPNLSFDNWNKKSGTWYPYAENATEAQKAWDTANPGLSVLSMNCTTPEYEHVAVAGKGKAAARIESKSVFGTFVAGNLFTGKFLGVVKLSGAKLNFGIPFSDRPKSLSGWYHYVPQPINNVKKPHKDLKGTLDKGSLEFVLSDRDEPLFINTTKGNYSDSENDPHTIAYGKLIWGKDSGDYRRFELNLDYRDDRTPKYLILILTSSIYGGDYTGGTGSVLYVDEFQLNY
ncbi:MAG: PCMD domain-containing protein [Bacteroidales bacterium]|nr:PCMD domain-containing protein [Bacteroidales bacterium]